MVLGNNQSTYAEKAVSTLSTLMDPIDENLHSYSGLSYRAPLTDPFYGLLQIAKIQGRVWYSNPYGVCSGFSLSESSWEELVARI